MLRISDFPVRIEKLEDIAEKAIEKIERIGEIKRKEVKKIGKMTSYYIEFERRRIFLKDSYKMIMEIEKNDLVRVYVEIEGISHCFIYAVYKDKEMIYFSISSPGKFREIYEKIGKKLKRVRKIKL